MECVFLNFKALSKWAAEINPIGIMDRLMYIEGASMLSVIGKEIPRIVYKCQLCASDQVEAWAEPGREPTPRVEVEVAKRTKESAPKKRGLPFDHKTTRGGSHLAQQGFYPPRQCHFAEVILSS